MDLFYQIFSDFSILVDSDYQTQPSDRFVDEISEKKIRMPNCEEYHSETLSECLRFIRRKLTQDIDVRSDFSQDPKILYVSRSTHLFNASTKSDPHWTKRVIRNDQVIKRTVKDRYDGAVFEVDKKHLPSAIDQLKTVSRADILFGIHGAGLNWIIAAKNGAVLYEFFPEHMFQYNGMNITRNLGLKYYTKHVEDRANIFNIEQIFDGLDISIKRWKAQAYSFDRKEISERVYAKMSDIVEKHRATPIKASKRKAFSTFRKVARPFLRWLRN